jgi:hypothetical protein
MKRHKYPALDKNKQAIDKQFLSIETFPESHMNLKIHKQNNLTLLLRDLT